MRKLNIKQRNPFHDHPLLRKNAVHQKTNKAKRKNAKQKLRNEWSSLSTLSQVLLKNSTRIVCSATSCLYTWIHTWGCELDLTRSLQTQIRGLSHIRP